MSAAGTLWDNEHGLHGSVEAGTGSVTRFSDGRATRFTFKKPFLKTPHVQLTPDFGNNPSQQFQQFYLYLMGSGAPAVDTHGFSVGMWSKPGHVVTFRYYATDIVDA